MAYSLRPCSASCGALGGNGWVYYRFPHNSTCAGRFLSGDDWNLCDTRTFPIMGKQPLPPNAPDNPPIRDPQPDGNDSVREPPNDPVQRNPDPAERDPVDSPPRRARSKSRTAMRSAAKSQHMARLRDAT